MKPRFLTEEQAAEARRKIDEEIDRHQREMTRERPSPEEDPAYEQRLAAWRKVDEALQKVDDQEEAQRAERRERAAAPGGSQSDDARSDEDGLAGESMDIYFDHVESLCGDEGLYLRINEPGETPSITVISYDNNPEPGSLIAFSYGLSSVTHPQWIHGRPELVICVDSLNRVWAMALGEVIRRGRGEVPFLYGSLLNFREPISDESTMSCFLVYACSVLDERAWAVELADRKVNIAQLYPIYESEMEVIKKIGAEKFLDAVDSEIYNVRREPYGGP